MADPQDNGTKALRRAFLFFVGTTLSSGIAWDAHYRGVSVALAVVAIGALVAVVIGMVATVVASKEAETLPKTGGDHS